MWAFQGKYTGEVKLQLQAKKKKEFKIFAWCIGVFILVMLIVPVVALGFDDIGAIAIIDGFVLIMGAALFLILYFYYSREPKCDIKIDNGGFSVRSSEANYSFAFYNIQEMEFCDDFIVVKPQVNAKIILQKELLVQGDWDELKDFLKKVEDSLETEDPVFQIDEPETECFTATVKDKRIYERFVTGVSMATPVGKFEYYGTFVLENGEEREFSLGQEWFEKLEAGKTGSLILINGNFFAFDDGEEIGG